MEFNSRSTYLAAVKDWQFKYFSKIAEIRAIKLKFKDVHREQAKGKFAHVYGLRSELHDAQNDLVKLVVQREEGRREAHRQYIAAHS
jgi:hypothetical protein